LEFRSRIHLGARSAIDGSQDTGMV
jgi:hypothetical protein